MSHSLHLASVSADRSGAATATTIGAAIVDPSLRGGRNLTHLRQFGQKSPAYLGHAGTVVGAIPSLSQVAAVPALHVLSRSLG